MPDQPVHVFFYGSYISLEVLAEVDYRPDWFETARLHGYDLRIAPRANLVPADGHMVYGIVASANHAELQRLYDDHARGILGETYVPFPVLVQTINGSFRPALSYLCEDMHPRPAENAYVERIATAAAAHNFPSWYLERINNHASS